MTSESLPVLPESEAAACGAYLARELGLRRDPDYHNRWQTGWGSKTDLGLYLTIRRFLLEGAPKNQTQLRP